MKKPTQPKLKTVDDVVEDEPVERLKVNVNGANDELDDFGIGEDAVSSLAADEIDSLLSEERLVNDQDLDRLFTEEKVSKHDDVEVEVRKALYQPKTSKADLMRSKSADAIKTSLEEATQHSETLEDEWDGRHIVEQGKTSKAMLYTALSMVVLLIAGGAWALWQVRSKDSVGHGEKITEHKEKTIRTQKVTMTALEQIKVLEKTFKEFANAETIEDKMRLLYFEESEKDEVRRHFEKHGVAKIENLQIERIVEEIVRKRQVWTIVYGYGHGANVKQDWIYFRKNEAGVLKIDWKSHLNYQAKEVKQMIAKRSSEPFNVRCNVMPRFADGQYNWGFTEDQYWAYKIGLFDGTVLWGYVNKEDIYLQKEMLESVELMKSFSRVYPQLKKRMILRVSYPENTNELNTQCVRITKIVSEHAIDVQGMADEKIEDKKENE